MGAAIIVTKKKQLQSISRFRCGDKVIIVDPQMVKRVGYPIGIDDAKKKVEEPRCFGEFKGVIVETDSVVEDYREYYRRAKSHLFKWRARNRPEWVDEAKSLENSSKLC